MELKPLEQFICDHCHEVIRNPQEGYVEWMDGYDNGVYITWNYRIVHHALHSPRTSGNCYYGYNNNLPLAEFLGHRGMVLLLSFLDVGPYHQRDYQAPGIRNMREFVEFIRRVTILYYEEAKLYWNEALGDGFFEGANETSIYSPETLQSLLQKYRK